MSSLLNFVLRHDGALHQAVISSGGLSVVFDPLIFQGDQAAIAIYLVQCADGPMGLFVPFDAGLVVIDLDKKTIWDVQVAMPLNYLSTSFDCTWVHLERLWELGWIGTGLVDTKTLAVVAPYTEEGPHYDWCDEQVEQYRARYKKEHPEIAWPKVSMELYGSLPRIPFAPLGWTFMGLDTPVESAHLLREGLIAVGFPIEERDAAGWSSWIEEHRERHG